MSDSGTAGFEDFDSSTLTFTFGPASGMELCGAINITRDGIVEDTESFGYQLRATPEVEDVLITNGSGDIFIEDSPLDSMLILIETSTAAYSVAN